jgi:hypothetical protein
VQGGAHGQGSVGIDGAIAFFDKLDDALLINDDVGAQSPLVAIVIFRRIVSFEDAVGLEHLAVHVAEEREGDTDLLGERGVSSGAIHADAENFRIRSVNFTGGDSSLDRLKLLRSTTSEGQDVDGQEDVLLAAEVAELHAFPAVAQKREIRRGITDLECHLRDLGLFALGGSRNNRKGGCSQKPESDPFFHRKPLIGIRSQLSAGGEYTSPFR